MPQLSPSPWFAILMFSWLIFLTVLPTKVMNHTFTNEIMALNPGNLKSGTWNWPWH
nr:ATP synthase F0 subunit 8 [Schilbe cf. yangambianus FDBS-2022]